MRHGLGLRKLNRTSSHRLAMLRNMMNSLIEHEVIKTTVPKAKELRRVVEPMITLAKEATVANRRLAFDRLRDRDSVVKLFNVLGPRFKARPGGYTRILKMGFRVGDNAPMCLLNSLIVVLKLWLQKLKQPPNRLQYKLTARWSSLVARWAHNPKVGGSNPSRATT